MYRRSSRNDEALCVLCDFWWLWLLILFLIIAAILTRQYWLPLIGVDVPDEPGIPTIVVPTIDIEPPQATQAVVTPAPTQVIVPTAPSSSPTPQSGPIAIGARAPDFTLPLLDGGEVTLGQYLGKPVLLVFFASFNSYSEAGGPTLQAIRDDYSQDELVIIGINIAYNDRKEDVQQFVSDYGWTFPVAMDETGQVIGLYEQDNIPAHIFIDAAGTIVAIEGIMTDDQINQKVSNLIQQ